MALEQGASGEAGESWVAEPDSEPELEGELGAHRAPQAFSPLQKDSVGRAGSLCSPPPFECLEAGCRGAFF